MKKKKSIKKSTLLIALCWLVYTCSYIGKLGYSANITQIENAYDVSHGQAGMVSTFFFFAYGAGQILNGLFSRRYNIRVFVFGALIISAAANIGVALTSYFVLIKYLWLINGVALSVLWPCLIRFLSETLAQKDSPRAVVVMGTTVATGTFLVYGLSALFVAVNAFRAIFYVAAALLPAVALVYFFAYPKLTDIEKTEEPLLQKVEIQTKNKKGGGLLVSICIIAVFAVITNLVKDGLTTWVPMILKETYDLPDSLSILLTLLLPALAIFGTAVAVALHKKIPDFVTLCATLFIVTAALIGTVITFMPTGTFVITLAAFALVSCLMSSVNNVITSMMPLYLKDKINSGLLAGILNGFCYIGSTISSYGLGSVADAGGWNMVFWLLFIVSATVALIGYGYTIIRRICVKKEKI